MSQFNLRYVPTLSAGEFILNGQRFNTQGAIINGNTTTRLTTEVIINDQTKNQALYANILALEGEVSGNVNPNLVVVDARLNALESNVFILQGEMNAVEGNITILQGNVVNLQNQINVLTGNIVIDEELIAELQRDTQFLEAPYAGLVGNTSYFVNGLQMWSGADENGNGLFVYKDAGAGNVGLNQIRLGVEDNKNILIAGGSQLLKPKSTGNVSIKNTDGNFQFLVGDRNTANFQSLSQTEINGDVRLKGQDNSKIEVYTQPATVVPPAPAVKRVDIRGDQELRLFGPYVAVNEDGGANVVGQNGAFTMTGSSGGYITTAAKDPTMFAPGGSSPGSVSLQIGECDLNTVGKINIGTTQGLTELGFKEINIGQSGPPAAARKSSTFIHGDMYMDYGGLVPPNTGLWDLLLYQGLPTIYSGPTNAPVKTTVNPYFRSISTFAPDYTNNSFIQTTGTFTVQVGAGAIVQNCGIGGYSLSCLGGAVGVTALVGGVLITTAAGAIQMTTGAGAINMTTGAAPIQMETNIGDVLIKAGYAFDSTPQLSLGSIYLQARDYTYITPDKNVVVGAGIEAPFNAVIANTINNNFFGNIFSPGTITGNVVKSNAFITPNVKSSVVNPLIANLYYQGNIIGQTGQAQASLFYGNGTIWTISEIATVPYYGLLAANGNLSNYETTKFTFNFTDLPINANMFYEVAPIQFDPNITNDRYGYGTWQANTQIQSNISILLNAFIEPAPPTYDRYLTVLGNASFQSDVECNSNIIVQKDAFPLLKTELTNNSIFTSGDITCQTLNYTTLNPPIVPGGVESIIAGTNVTISPLNGQGNVVINAIVPAAAGVNQIIAGNGIEISPVGGQGNVTVSLAGSVIPPGGYLPIAGGIMTGEIHQYPSTGNLQENTYKLYRPQSSYQPPFPSIGPPTFDGELLTFYNGDNSTTLNYFTGWFPQDTFVNEPDVITKQIAVSGGPAVNFYSSSGGSPTTGQYISTPINQFKVGDHLTSGQMNVIAAQVSPTFGAVLAFYTGPQFDPGSPSKKRLFQVNLTNFPTGGSGGTYNIPIDYVYLGGQQAVNWMEIQLANDIGENNYITINTIGGQNWEGFIDQNGTLQTHFVAVLGDPNTSALYEYFPSTGLTSKLLAINKGSSPLSPPQVYGIYCDDVETTRTIIIYGDFYNVVQGSSTIPVNYIFMYNIDTNTVIPLRTNSTDPNFPNGSTGLQDVVFGVDKQSTLTSAKKVWIWGAYNNVNPMGNLSPPSDSPIPGSSINFTTTDNWTNFVNWGTSIDATNKLTTCVGGGKIMYDDPNNLSTFVLLVYASLRNGNFVGSIVAVTTDGSTYSSNTYAFPNGLFSTLAPSQPPRYISIVNTTAFITGKISGLASNGVSDVQFYSIVATDVGNFWNGSLYNSNLRIVANSTDAAFWNSSGILETTRVAGMSNGTVVIGSEGYGVQNLGGGVLTFPIANVATPTSPATKYTIANINPYNVRNIVGNTANAVQLGCGLNQNNFWFGQTFDSTLQPIPPTIPTVNAINGAKFLVDNYAMDKIVFSGNISTDYASVSFIAGNSQNDKNWYWYSQVGAIDYFSGNTFYPNITSSGIGGSQNLTAGENITINGNIISLSNPLTANVNLSSFSINGNSIGQLNMTLDSTGLYQIDNFTDSSNLDTQSLLFVNNTNQQLVEVSAVTGFGMEDSTATTVGNFTNTAMVLSNVTNNSTFGILKLPFDANITNTTGNINISTPDILSITSQNAVEIGTPLRRQELVAIEVQNTGALTAQNYFDFTTGIQNISSFQVLTLQTFINTITVAYGYDDGNNGNSNITIQLIEDDGGVETQLFNYSDSTSSGLVNAVLTINPPITINPNATKFYFVRMTVPAGSPMYSYYGTISDGLSPYCVITGEQLQSVDDPIDFFNVYGNSFFQDNMLIHANCVVANPTNEFFYTQIEYNYIQLQGETFYTQVAPGSTYITSGVNQQVQQANLLQVKRTDQVSQSTITNTGITVALGSTQTTTINSTAFTVNNSGAPLKSGTLQGGLISLNNNDTNGSTINLAKDSISVATDVISTINSSTKDNAGTSRVFTRVQSRTSAVGAGNQDGTLAIFTLVNGVLLEVFNFHGGENENNSFRSLDMNGNSVRTTQGNIVLTAIASSGIGNATIQSKANAIINIDSGPSGRINFTTLTATATPNHNINFNSTSNGVTSASYLKAQLNGVDIWIPYLTTDPTV